MEASVLLIPLCGTLAIFAMLIVVGLVLGFLSDVIDGFLMRVFGAVVYERWSTVFFPGIVMHELSHALFLSASGARVGEVVVREDSRHPVVLFREKGWVPSDGRASNRVGHVSYERRGPYPVQAIQRAMGAFAPTVVGFACLVLLGQVIVGYCTVWWHYGLCVYLIACVLNGASMSTADVRDMIPGLPVVFGLVYAVLLITGFDAVSAILAFFPAVQSLAPPLSA